MRDARSFYGHFCQFSSSGREPQSFEVPGGVKEGPVGQYPAGSKVVGAVPIYGPTPG